MWTRLLLTCVLAGSGVARAETSPEMRRSISVEINHIEDLTRRLQLLGERKSMSGRGWTALDDIVLGGSTIVVSAGVAGALVGLRRAFPERRAFRLENLAFPLGASVVTAGFAVLTLLEGLLVFAITPKAELGLAAGESPAELPGVDPVSLDSLDQAQAEALLGRLAEVRLRLEVSVEALSRRLTPKLESRLAFMASTAVSGGLAVLAVGAGMYLIAGQSDRIMTRLVRLERTEILAAWLRREAARIQVGGQRLGLTLGIQGVIGVLSGGLIELFVPRSAVAAAPVN